MCLSYSFTVTTGGAAGRVLMMTAGDRDAPLPPPRCFRRVGDDVDNVAGLSGRGRFLGDKKGEDDDEEGGGRQGGGRILRPRGVVV